MTLLEGGRHWQALSGPHLFSDITSIVLLCAVLCCVQESRKLSWKCSMKSYHFLRIDSLADLHKRI